MTGIEEITSQEGYEALLKKPKLVVVHFYADWAAECQPMNEVLVTLSKDEEFKAVAFAMVAAENFPQISIQHNISAVPTFLFFLAGKQVDRLDGANAARLSQMVKNNNARAQILDSASIPAINPQVPRAENAAQAPPPPENLDATLKKLINQSPVMLFMKGNAENPQCGFSRQAVALLKQHEADFGTFDILRDERVRQGLKTYSNWPTYPQLYVNGELVGGLDIMKEMAEGGELADLLSSATKTGKAKEPIEERLRRLTNKAPLMVFMKGDPSTPRCGFSRQLVDILNDTRLPYDTFDILSDEDVRQGLKTFSNWPTYPQVYVKGNLVGGLDIIKELKEGGELMSTLKGE